MRCPIASGPPVASSEPACEVERWLPLSPRQPSAPVLSFLCSGRSTIVVPKGAVQKAVRHQLLDVADALIARAFELLQRELRRAIRLVQLFGALAGIPLRLEVWQRLVDLVEAYAIAARVRTGVGRERKLAARHDVGDDIGDFANAIILAGAADVEGLIEDLVARCREGGDEGPRNVLDVHDRTPRRAVGLQEY